MTQTKNKSDIAIHLNNYGLTMKDLASWLDMSENGLSRALKKECIKGFSAAWEAIIVTFLLRHGKGQFQIVYDGENGFEVRHELFYPEMFE